MLGLSWKVYGFYLWKPRFINSQSGSVFHQAFYQMLIPCFCLFLDFLWVPLTPAFSVGHRFLRRGREADGVGLWAAGGQAVRPGDADPTRTDVPRGPPHVVHSTASDGWGGGCRSGNWGFYWKHTFRVLQRQMRERELCVPEYHQCLVQTNQLILNLFFLCFKKNTCGWIFSWRAWLCPLSPAPLPPC